jgi:hypothetical protein
MIMKKIFLSVLLVFSICCAPKVFAQESASSEDGNGIFGVRFMPTLTSLQYSENQGVVETSFILGYGAGLLLGTNFNDNVGLQGELIFSQLAQKYKTGGDIERKVKLNYINVPLLLSLNTGIHNPVNLNFVIGPQLGLNTGSSVEVNNGTEADTVHAVLAVKRGDIGFAYGVGVDFGSEVKFSVGFRGVYGLVDISDRSRNITTSEYYILDRAHVRTYSGYVGLSFLF